MLFQLLALAVLALALWFLLRPLLRPRPIRTPRAAHDIEVYQRQLAELDRDVARGATTAEDAAMARIEIGRRLLRADAELKTAAIAAPVAPSPLAVGFVVVALMLGCGAYLYVGQPGMRDQPLHARMMNPKADNRPSQEQAEKLAAEAGTVPAPPPLPQPGNGLPDFPTLVANLEKALVDRPDDLRGLRLLAGAYSRLGRYVDARKTWERIILQEGDAATAESFGALAEVMLYAAGGYASPEAVAAMDRALQLAPDDPRARYYRALAHVQLGERRAALAIWAPLLAADPDAPYAATLKEMIIKAAEEEGLDPLAFLPEVKGPTAEQMRDAEAMTPEARQAMIEGMVKQLAEKLKENPTDMGGWARLLRAYQVQGKLAEAKAAVAEGLAALANDDQKREALRVLAQQFGVVP